MLKKNNLDFNIYNAVNSSNFTIDFIKNNNESGALTWLESNFPNYKQVVAEELEKLKTEIGKAFWKKFDQGDAEATEDKKLRASSALSTRNMAPAEGAPYNFAQMALGAALCGVTGVGLGVFLRKQKRDPKA